jgi:hypothetical protein
MLFVSLVHDRTGVIVKELLIMAYLSLEEIMDRAYKKGVIGCFKTIEECEKEAINFTKDEIKLVGGLLSDDYKKGYKEGVQYYLQKHNKIN